MPMNINKFKRDLLLLGFRWKKKSNSQAKLIVTDSKKSEEQSVWKTIYIHQKIEIIFKTLKYLDVGI